MATKGMATKGWCVTFVASRDSELTLILGSKLHGMSVVIELDDNDYAAIRGWCGDVGRPSPEKDEDVAIAAVRMLWFTDAEGQDLGVDETDGHWRAVPHAL